VLALVKAGLPESVVLEKIRTAPTEKLDTSTKALIALKGGGASAAVIETIMGRAGGPPQSQTESAPLPPPPPPTTGNASNARSGAEGAARPASTAPSVGPGI
jgi:hypothetical protein